MVRLVAWLLGKVSKRFLVYWTGEVIEPRLIPEWVTEQTIADLDKPSRTVSLGEVMTELGITEDELIDPPGIPTAEQEREAKVAEGQSYAPTVELPTVRSSICVARCEAGYFAGTKCTLFCVQLSNEQLVTEDKSLIDQAAKELLDGPGAPETIAYPKPTEDMSVTEWVDSRIGKGALNPGSLNQTTVSDGSVVPKGFSLSVRRGFSTSYLADIVRRANRKDPTLTLDQLAAARSRGLI